MAGYQIEPRQEPANMRSCRLSVFRNPQTDPNVRPTGRNPNASTGFEFLTDEKSELPMRAEIDDEEGKGPRERERRVPCSSPMK